MITPDDEPHPPLSSSGNAVLGAAGEAAAFLAGAPIAGAGDAAVGLGEVAAGREAQLETAVTGQPVTPARPWIWLVLGAVVVITALGWALKG